jgi:hypothetical protein
VRNIFVTTKKGKLISKTPVDIIHCNATELKEDRKQAWIRTHHIPLEGFDGWIIIRLSKIKGKLPMDSQFVSGNFEYLD